jgi:hypothetical protein
MRRPPQGTSPPTLPCLRQVNLQGSWYNKSLLLLFFRTEDPSFLPESPTKKGRDQIPAFPHSTIGEELERFHEQWKRSSVTFGEQSHQPKIASRFQAG